MNARTKLMPFFAALVATVGLAMAGSTANASTAAMTADDVGAQAACPAGKSCYYDNGDGSDNGWVAPRCGWQDLSKLSPPFNDRISGITNNSSSTAVLFNWSGYWELVGVVYPGQSFLPIGSRINNVVDAVSITC